MTPEPRLWPLEERQVFSRSVLWRLQRRYFEERGVEAWRRGEVPHYVTSNPRMADACAEMAVALRRDLRRRGEIDEGGALQIVELGAGSGRFAFHFLRRLARLREREGLPRSAFRYAMTDVVPETLAFWRRHPAFESDFAAGTLDLALFDVEHPAPLALQASGSTLGPGGFQGPLVVFAHYFFDSIPQELVHVSAGSCRRSLVSTFLDEDPEGLDAARILERAECRFEDDPAGEIPESDPVLRDLLESYRRRLPDGYVLLPSAGLRCLRELASWSEGGLVLLAADREQRPETPGTVGPPLLLRHGSFSLPVAFDALQALCESQGGAALLPGETRGNLTLGAFLLTPAAGDLAETRRAFERHVRDFGPYDYYAIFRHARDLAADLAFPEILALLRLGLDDAHQLAGFLPRLRELAPALGADERAALRRELERVWDAYFPLAEPLDLAGEIAALLYEMDEPAAAIPFFERSNALYGEHTGTLFNIAACRRLLGEHDEADRLLARVLQHDPGNEEARALLRGSPRR